MNNTKLIEPFTYYFGTPVWIYFSATYENMPFVKATNNTSIEFLFAQNLYLFVANGFHAQNGMDFVEFYTNGEIPFYDESI